LENYHQQVYRPLYIPQLVTEDQDVHIPLHRQPNLRNGRQAKLG